MIKTKIAAGLILSVTFFSLAFVTEASMSKEKFAALKACSTAYHSALNDAGYYSAIKTANQNCLESRRISWNNLQAALIIAGTDVTAQSDARNSYSAAVTAAYKVRLTTITNARKNHSAAIQEAINTYRSCRKTALLIP
jgi:hypothetical protein